MRIRAQSKWFILISLLILAFSAMVSASTTVPPGEVSGTWSVAGSPYVVEGNINIPVGDTLVIEPGVTVQFETDAGMWARGTLTAVGTAASRIHFTSAQISPGPGDWKWVEIGSSSSSLAWIQIDYATDGLVIRESSPSISDCTVRYNADTGIWVVASAVGCSGSSAAPAITRCQVELNLGDGVEYLGFGNPDVGCTIPKTGFVGGTLSESTVHNNTGTGIVIRGIDGFMTIGRANPKVLSCDIHDNDGNGILLTGYSTGATISGSDVYLNAQSGIVRESWLGTVTITNNELRENTGVGLRNSSYQTIVSGNWIINNNSEGIVTSQLRQFNENMLYGNVDDYDFIYMDTVDQVAPLNDWGTSDPVVIDSHIWDRLDNPSLGRVVVSPATDLVVTPETDLEFSGQAGGPFYPEKATWTLWNTQTDALDWEIAGAESWLSTTSLSGTLAPFDSVLVTAETSAEAESLPPGTYTATLAFQNTSTGDGDTQHTVRLSVMERHLAFVDVHSDGMHGSAESVAVSPDGAHVFVVSGNTLAVFVRDGVTGELTLLEEHEDGQGGVDGLFYAWSVALSPDGENVYVTGRVDNAIAVFDRNPVTGALTFLEFHKDGVDGVDGLDDAVSVAVSPDGAHVYIASWNDDAVAVFARNASTGRLTFVEVQRDSVGGVAGLEHAESLALSPDGTHVYVAAGWSDDFLTVFVRDTSTGTLTFLETHEEGVGGVDGLSGESRVALSPDGAHVYVTSDHNDSVALFARDTSTGTLTYKRVYEDNVDGGGLNGATGLVVSADGAYLFIASLYSDALSVFGRNAATGELLFVESHRDGVDGVDGLDQAQAVAISPDGAHVYVGSGSYSNDKIALFSRVSALVADLSIDDVTVTEGDAGTVDAVFTVSLSAASAQEVTVDFATVDGTATAGSDYVATSGTLIFGAGTTTRTVTVVVNGDLLAELNETFLVNLSNPVNASISDGQGQGAITDDEASNFQINTGLNDAWYNPVTDGQGFFITVFPDLGVVSLAWFTYDTELPPPDAEANLGDAGHRWLTALGPIIGNQVIMDITLTSGGIFDTPGEVDGTDPPGSDGTLTLTFDSCNSGTVEYDIPSINRQGVVPIQRVADDNVALCISLAGLTEVQLSKAKQGMGSPNVMSVDNPVIAVEAQPVTEMNPGLNDAWYNPVTDGQGFFITVFPDLGYVSLAWFTYDTELPPEDATANFGDPGHRWITAAGEYIDNQAVMNITLTSGGIFDTPTDVQRTDPPGSDGTIILTFDSCNSGTVEYDILSINRQGTIPIVRVADDNIAICEALTAD